MKRVVIYTDGACSGNPGVGGWGEGFQHIRIQLAQIKGNALSGIIADHRQNRAIEIILFASAQDAESLLQIIHSKPHPIFVM